jgi:hypothetical protein
MQFPAVYFNWLLIIKDIFNFLVNVQNRLLIPNPLQHTIILIGMEPLHDQQDKRVILRLFMENWLLKRKMYRTTSGTRAMASFGIGSVYPLGSTDTWFG